MTGTLLQVRSFEWKNDGESEPSRAMHKAKENMAKASRRIAGGNIAPASAIKSTRVTRDVHGLFLANFPAASRHQLPVYVTRQCKSLPRDALEEHRNSRRLLVILSRSRDNRPTILNSRIVIFESPCVIRRTINSLRSLSTNTYTRLHTSALITIYLSLARTSC